MALLHRNKLFYNQLKQIHRSIGGSSVPTYNMNLEKKAFKEVLPEVINAIVTSPRLTRLPEVKRWIKKLKQMHRSIGGSSVPTYNMNLEKKAFKEVLPEVINAIVTSPRLTELPQVQRWMKKLLEYTVGGGKLGRGLMVSIGYRMFEDPEYFSEETQHSARILGWCTEMVQVKFLMLDDITDRGIIRRGKPCWYLQPNVGLSGVKDALLIYQSMLDIVDMYFGRTPIYSDVLKTINESIYQATIGEDLNSYSTYNKEKNNLDVFNMKLIDAIAINKLAYYTFKSPIFIALLLTKNGKQKATEALNNICMQFGRLMQCQDDYIDVYVADSVTGKTGRDIQEGKCTWVAVTALQHCNDAQRAIFKEYYGSQDSEHVQRIKQLYDELNIPQLYEQHERKMYDDILRRIHALPAEGDRIFLLGVLNDTYKRVC